jgi:LysM repeat protein
METAAKLEKPALDRTLVAYNPKTLGSIKEEKHVVTDGETIARLARKYKTSPVLIAQENGLPSIHDNLKKDQELNIPKMPKVKAEKEKPEPIVMSGVIPPEPPKDAPNPMKDARARASKALQASLNAYGRKKLSEEASPKNPELWSRAKSLAKEKFDVYPSKYANQWASKWYKSKGGSWKSVNEGTNTPDEREWGTSSLVRIYRKDTPGEQVKEAVPLGYEFGNQGIGDEYGIVKSPTGLGMGYSIPMTESPDKGTDTMGLWSSPRAETDKDILETKKPRFRVVRLHK